MGAPPSLDPKTRARGACRRGKPTRLSPPAVARPRRTSLPSPSVRIVVCGNADRGDDGVALAAAATLLPTLAGDLGSCLEIRRRPDLRVEDLVDLRRGEHCLIIDAITGVAPGEVVVRSLDALDGPPGFSARSSRELPIELVVGLAAVIREEAINGSFVGLGGQRWSYGTPLSRSARAGLPAFRAAIAREIERLIGAPVTVALLTLPITG